MGTLLMRYSKFKDYMITQLVARNSHKLHDIIFLFYAYIKIASVHC